MTKEQVLQAEGEALSRLAGKVFCEYICLKCELNSNTCGHFPDCSNFTVKLTPDNAFKWRDETQHMVFWQAMIKVCNSVVAANPQSYNCGLDYAMWVTTKATPAHYIKAAMLCKISE